MKHIDVKHHYIRDCMEVGDVTFKHIPTAENRADILTKGLDGPKYWKFFTLLGLR
jgi:hypothetical protein